MRNNLARGTANEEPDSSADLWNQILYLDPDFERMQTNPRNGDHAAIIAVLFILILMFVVVWSLHGRGL